MPIDISVVVPTRNRSSLVSRLLNQLVRLDGGLTYEVIVIDEGSSDDTPARLARFAADADVRVIRHDPPVGLPAARNVGLREASGDYIAWIDDDDLTAPDRLARQHAALTARGGGWSCAGRVDVDDDLQVLSHLRCPVVRPGGRLIEELLTFNCLPTAAQGLLVERGLANAIGGYDESLRAAEDWEFCIRLAEACEPHLLDEPLVGYRLGPPSMSSDTTRMDVAIEAVFRIHADLLATHGVAPDWQRIHESLMMAELKGSRWRSAVRAARAFRAAPTPHRAARCALVFAAPRWFDRRSAARRSSQVPEAWRRQAQSWLAGVIT